MHTGHLDTELAGTGTWSETQCLLELEKSRKRRADLLFWHESVVKAVENGMPPASTSSNSGMDLVSIDRETRQVARAVNGKRGVLVSY